MAKLKSIKAARPVRLEGSSDTVGGPTFNPDHYDDDVMYDVKLTKPVNYPEGSENWLPPDSAVRLSGKVVKLFGGDIIRSAIKNAEPEAPPPADAPARTNLFSVKGFKGPTTHTR
jgi:hypothetical protein